MTFEWTPDIKWCSAINCKSSNYSDSAVNIDQDIVENLPDNFRLCLYL